MSLIGKFVAGGPEDHYSASWQALGQEWTDENGNIYHKHSDDQVVVTWQQQPPGFISQPGATVYLAIELSPGVPR